MDVMCKSANILFTNSDEAQVLCGFDDGMSPEHATNHLSKYCPLCLSNRWSLGFILCIGEEKLFIPHLLLVFQLIHMRLVMPILVVSCAAYFKGFQI